MDSCVIQSLLFEGTSMWRAASIESRILRYHCHSGEKKQSCVAVLDRLASKAVVSSLIRPGSAKARGIVTYIGMAAVPSVFAEE